MFISVPFSLMILPKFKLWLLKRMGTEKIRQLIALVHYPFASSNSWLLRTSCYIIATFLQFSSLHFPTLSFNSPMAIYASSSSSPPRSSMFYYAGNEDSYEKPHFLEACFLCRKPLGQNRDIFMYRLAQFSIHTHSISFSFYAESSYSLWPI